MRFKGGNCFINVVCLKENALFSTNVLLFVNSRKTLPSWLVLPCSFQNIKFPNRCPQVSFCAVSLSLSSLPPIPLLRNQTSFFSLLSFCFPPLSFRLALLHSPPPPPLSIALSPLPPPSLSLPPPFSLALSSPSLSLSPPPPSLSLPPPLSLALSLPLSRSTPSVFFFSLFLFLSVAPSLWPLSSHTRFGADSLFIAPVVLSLWQPSWRPGRQGAIFGAPL